MFFTMTRLKVILKHLRGIHSCSTLWWIWLDLMPTKKTVNATIATKMTLPACLCSNLPSWLSSFWKYARNQIFDFSPSAFPWNIRIYHFLSFTVLLSSNYWFGINKCYLMLKLNIFLPLSSNWSSTNISQFYKKRISDYYLKWQSKC